jgi:hypothetical protein
MKRYQRGRFARAFLPSFKSLCLIGVMGLSFLTIGCGEHRYYDPYYHDYHTWNGAEIDYYHRWAVETHRDPNRDFRHIPKEEQHQYWDWRHNQR